MTFSDILFCRRISRSIFRPLLGMLLCLLIPASASAKYDPWKFFVWQSVVADGKEGRPNAVCSNGEPYIFFVNRALSDNVSINFAPGGACYDSETCNKEVVGFSAANSDGIKEDYLWNIKKPDGMIFGSLSPMTRRLSVLDGVDLSVQSWNYVHLPYCTADAHVGNSVVDIRASITNGEPDGRFPARQMHFKGHANTKAVVKWIDDNLFINKYKRINRLLVTGGSAGSIGATFNYAHIRATLNPKYSYLFADSGVVFPGPKGGAHNVYPAAPFYDAIRSPWGLDSGGGVVSSLKNNLQNFNENDFGSIYTSLATTFQNDRFGVASFQRDYVFPLFNYSNTNILVKDLQGKSKSQMLEKLFRQDLDYAMSNLSVKRNTGYWIPYWREPIYNHVLAVLNMPGSGIEEQGYKSVSVFIENIVGDNTQPMMRKYETDNVSDHYRFFEWALAMLISANDFFEALFGISKPPAS